MIKTGIMGGTFNPIHNAHLIIAEYAREQFELDSVWFMTSGNPPHKRDERIEDAHIRQEMVRAAIENNPYFEVCSYEVDKQSYSYTAQTLEEFSKRYTDREFYFIIGADSLYKIMQWYKPEVITSHCTLLVFARRGTKRLKELAQKRAEVLNADIRIIDSPMIDISSSMIRERIAQGKSIRYLVPDSTERYIRKNGLYAPKP